MSYEGYEQALCKNGHYNVYAFPDLDWFSDTESLRCEDCGAGIVWINSVNITNGSFQTDENGKEERIDGYVELEIDKKAEYHFCETCGHKTLTRQETFKIPEEK